MSFLTVGPGDSNLGAKFGFGRNGTEDRDLPERGRNGPKMDVLYWIDQFWQGQDFNCYQNLH